MELTLVDRSLSVTDSSSSSSSWLEAERRYLLLSCLDGLKLYLSANAPPKARSSSSSSISLEEEEEEEEPKERKDMMDPLFAPLLPPSPWLEEELLGLEFKEELPEALLLLLLVLLVALLGL